MGACDAQIEEQILYGALKRVKRQRREPGTCQYGWANTEKYGHIDIKRCTGRQRTRKNCGAPDTMRGIEGGVRPEWRFCTCKCRVNAS